MGNLYQLSAGIESIVKSPQEALVRSAINANPIPPPFQAISISCSLGEQMWGIIYNPLTRGDAPYYLNQMRRYKHLRYESNDVPAYPAIYFSGTAPNGYTYTNYTRNPTHFRDLSLVGAGFKPTYSRNVQNTYAPAPAAEVPEYVFSPFYTSVLSTFANEVLTTYVTTIHTEQRDAEGNLLGEWDVTSTLSYAVSDEHNYGSDMGSMYSYLTGQNLSAAWSASYTAKNAKIKRFPWSIGGSEDVGGAVNVQTEAAAIAALSGAIIQGAAVGAPVLGSRFEYIHGRQSGPIIAAHRTQIKAMYRTRYVIYEYYALFDAGYFNRQILRIRSTGILNAGDIIELPNPTNSAFPMISAEGVPTSYAVIGIVADVAYGAIYPGSEIY